LALLQLWLREIECDDVIGAMWEDQIRLTYYGLDVAVRVDRGHIIVGLMDFDDGIMYFDLPEFDIQDPDKSLKDIFKPIKDELDDFVAEIRSP
jgi:hypothetical protein